MMVGVHVMTLVVMLLTFDDTSKEFKSILSSYAMMVPCGVVGILVYLLLVLKFGSQPLYKKSPLNYIMLVIFVSSMNCLLVGAAYRLEDIKCFLIPSIVLMAYVIMNYFFAEFFVDAFTRRFFNDPIAAR
jgi:hypothetical protein